MSTDQSPDPRVDRNDGTPRPPAPAHAVLTRRRFLGRLGGRVTCGRAHLSSGTSHPPAHSTWPKSSPITSPIDRGK
jgi:hypothetical protein